ncbi:MAG: hypothetical protein WC600_17255 [Desulfobaccales bacterium]
MSEKENPVIDATQAKALIEQEKQERVKRCEAKINQALQDERCKLSVAFMISEHGNTPQLSVFAQD